MHPAARAYVRRQVAYFGPFERVVEFGGRNVNGGVRDLFAGAVYLSIDKRAGPGVDIVMDCRHWPSTQEFDAVVCCEVLEHSHDPQGIIASAGRVLVPGGRMIFTFATDPRAPHSGFDGGAIHLGEHYRNVGPIEIAKWCALAGFDDVEFDAATVGDLYVTARKGT